MPFCSSHSPSLRRRDLRVEDEEVPGEAAAGAERRVDALEDAAAVGPGGQVAERAEGARRRARRARRARARACRPRAARGRRRPRLPARAPARASPATSRSRARCRPVSRATGIATRPLPTASSTSGPSGLPGELDVEGDVLGHVRRPVVVDRREGVVGAHVALSLARDHARAAAVYAAPARRGGARVAAPPVSSRGASFPVPTTPGGGHGRQER